MAKDLGVFQKKDGETYTGAGTVMFGEAELGTSKDQARLALGRDLDVYEAVEQGVYEKMETTQKWGLDRHFGLIININHGGIPALENGSEFTVKDLNSHLQRQIGRAALCRPSVVDGPKVVRLSPAASWKMVAGNRVEVTQQPAEIGRASTCLVRLTNAQDGSGWGCKTCFKRIRSR